LNFRHFVVVVVVVVVCGFSLGNFVDSLRDFLGYYAHAYPVQFGLFWLCWTLFGIGMVHMMLYRGDGDDGQLSRGSKDVLRGILRLIGMVYIDRS
jgi:hypothetical protein